MHSTPVMFPNYAGDGIGEHQVDREYKGRDGNVVLDVDTMFISTNVMEAAP